MQLETVEGLVPLRYHEYRLILKDSELGRHGFNFD
jgi:hypothetical protein